MCEQSITDNTLQTHMGPYGVFTLPDIDAVTDTDKNGFNYNM